MDIQGDAIFSNETPPRFRHRLDRWWSDKPRALVCMANPSRAGADKNDPTLHSLIRLIRPRPHTGGLVVVNWEPYIATNPDALHRWRARAHEDTLGDIHAINLSMIRALSKVAAIRIVAWGDLVPDVPHTTNVLDALSLGGTEPLYAFGFTKRGSPKHPMARGRSRIPDGTRPVLWDRG